jgi:hypothetical protein
MGVFMKTTFCAPLKRWVKVSTFAILNYKLLEYIKLAKIVAI